MTATAHHPGEVQAQKLDGVGVTPSELARGCRCMNHASAAAAHLDRFNYFVRLTHLLPVRVSDSQRRSVRCAP